MLIPLEPEDDIKLPNLELTEGASYEHIELVKPRCEIEAITITFPKSPCKAFACI
jgi:hypothetical protein